MRAQLAPQLGAGADVERGERLVEQQQPRLGRERARQRDPLLPGRRRAARGFAPARSARPTRSSHSSARAGAPRRARRRGCAARTRRSRARSGAGRAGSPGTRRRPSAARARRTCPSPGRRPRRRRSTMRPAVDRQRARRARAAASSCPRRSGRGRRRSRRRPRRAATSRSSVAELEPDVSVERHADLRTSGRAATTSTTIDTASSTRLERDRDARVATRGGGRPRAASSACGPGCCRRR